MRLQWSTPEITPRAYLLTRSDGTPQSLTPQNCALVLPEQIAAGNVGMTMLSDGLSLIHSEMIFANLSPSTNSTNAAASSSSASVLKEIGSGISAAQASAPNRCDAMQPAAGVFRPLHEFFRRRCPLSHAQPESGARTLSRSR